MGSPMQGDLLPPACRCDGRGARLSGLFS